MSDTNPTYRSGAAARLAGVPVETLRVWERRYGLTEPARSARGQRQYSLEDVRRLGLIKQLVDAGNAIGALAHLNLAQLLAMLSVGAQKANVQGWLKVSLVGTLLRPVLMHYFAQTKLSLVQTVLDVQQLQPTHTDVLVLELGEVTAVDEHILKMAQQACEATAVLILYRFASNQLIAQLRLAGFHVARMTTDVLEIEHLCRLAISEQPQRSEKNHTPPAQVLSSNIPQRLLNDEHLMHIAQAAASVQCECPRHLVDLLQMLTSFERYSAQCENCNIDDAALHRDLHHTAAQARSALEQALVRVAQFEGIEY